MAYALEVTEAAQDDLRRLDKMVAQRVVKKLRWLAANVEEVNHEALTGQWTGYFRWRMGDYRVIYMLDHDDRLLIVAVIGHRRDIYDT